MSKSTEGKALSLPFKRVGIKVSGEVLGNSEALSAFVAEVVTLSGSLSLVITVGGGNVFRGRSATFQKTPRLLTDAIGMSASLTNGLFLKSLLWEAGVPSTVLSPIDFPGHTQCFSGQYLTQSVKPSILIIAGGTGEPYFSTDMAAVLGALKTECDLLLKATTVQGVFDADPATVPEASFLETVSYDQLLENGWTIMDLAALGLAKQHRLKIRICHWQHPAGLGGVLAQQGPYTDIS